MRSGSRRALGDGRARTCNLLWSDRGVPGQKSAESPTNPHPTRSEPSGGTAVRTFLREFREFALRSNVVDLAVAVVIGVAFNAN